VQINEELIKSY